MTLGFSGTTKAVLSALALIYVVILWIAIEALSSLYIGNAHGTARENLQQRLALLTSELEVALYKDILISESLTASVQVDPDFTVRNWREFSANLLSKTTFVRNIGIAPQDIILKTYPMAGNEASIGLDYRDVPEQYRTIIIARQRKDVYLAGPVKLVQGGLGLIARFPIYRDFPDNNDYWGVFSVVLDHAKLMESIGFNSIEGLNIAIRRADEQLDFNPQSVFWGEHRTFDQSDIRLSMSLPGATWELAATYQLEDSIATQRLQWVIRAIGWGLGAALLLVLVVLYRYFQFTRIASLQDELTHLPNRRFAMHQLSQLMQKERSARSFAILSIDLDEFKRINDVYGHDTGDGYLIHVAKALVESVRASDYVARLGGDEFIIILHRVETAGNVNTMREKIIEHVQQCQFETTNGVISPKLSVGIATAKDHGSLSELLKAADKDMYKQKHAKRQNNVAMAAIF